MPKPSGPPLILAVDLLTPVTEGTLDLYLPETSLPAPCVMLVHGLYPTKSDVLPRDSNFYRGYASHLARRGLVVGVVNHDLTDGALYQEALVTVTKAVEDLRADPRTEGDRVGMWFFSGGGPLAYPFLVEPPPWLKAVELTYPVLPGADTPGWPDPDDVVEGIKTVPTYVTLVENEVPDFVAGQRYFVQRAETVGAPLNVRTVDGAGHGFDAMLGEAHAREAVEAGLEWMVSTLTR